MEKIKLHKDILNLRHCVIKDPTNVALEGIKIIQKDGEQTGIATDGQKLIKVTVPVDNDEEFELLLKPIKVSKKLNDYTTFTLIGDSYLSENGDKLENIKNYNIYPEYERAIPREEKHTLHIKLNPTLLMDLAKGFDLYKHQGFFLEINPDDVLAPIIVKLYESSEDLGVLMPMYQD